MFNTFNKLYFKNFGNSSILAPLTCFLCLWVARPGLLPVSIMFCCALNAGFNRATGNKGNEQVQAGERLDGELYTRTRRRLLRGRAGCCVHRSRRHWDLNVGDPGRLDSDPSEASTSWSQPPSVHLVSMDFTMLLSLWWTVFFQTGAQINPSSIKWLLSHTWSQRRKVAQTESL